MRRPFLLSFDVLVVVLFVIAGRSSHQESQGFTEILETAGPFLLALAAGWVVTRAWRRPTSTIIGLGVLATTVAGGMLLRRFAFDEGTALSFVIVATTVLTIGLLGWRLIAAAVIERRSPAIQR